MRTILINNGTYLESGHFEDFDNSLELNYDGINKALYEVACVMSDSKTAWKATSENDLIELDLCDNEKELVYWSFQSAKIDDDGYLRSVDIYC